MGFHFVNKMNDDTRPSASVRCLFTDTMCTRHVCPKVDEVGGVNNPSPRSVKS